MLFYLVCGEEKAYNESEDNLAEKDIAEKNFIALNDVFADIFNGLLFAGKQIITGDSLEDIPTVSQYRAEDTTLHEQERDTSKLWNGYGINLVMMGIENQIKPDKDMPFRIISYDGASYRSQLLKTEEIIKNGRSKKILSRKRYPVITIVLYFGKKLWKYPKNLCDCFYPKLPVDETTEVLKKYIQNYKIHVFDIPRMKPEELNRFHSDFRIVAEYFINAYTNAEYTPNDAVITHVDEFLKLMQVLTGDNRYEEISRSFVGIKKEGGIKMCDVLDAREARGEIRGEARLGKLISLLLEKNLLEEAKKAAENKKVREEYYALYNI